MKIYVIADTHFGHELIHQLGIRPADFEKRFYDSWHKTVKPDDLLIHLGDLAFTGNTPVGQMINLMPGHKVFVRGNHDSGYEKYYKVGFDFVCDSFQVEYMGFNLTFSHKPRYPYKVTVNELNIHGHLHGDHHRLEGELEWYKIFKDNHQATEMFPSGKFPYIDMAPEKWGCKVISLDTILKAYQKGTLP